MAEFPPIACFLIPRGNVRFWFCFMSAVASWLSHQGRSERGAASVVPFLESMSAAWFAAPTIVRVPSNYHSAGCAVQQPSGRLTALLHGGGSLGAPQRLHHIVPQLSRDGRRCAHGGGHGSHGEAAGDVEAPRGGVGEVDGEQESLLARVLAEADDRLEPEREPRRISADLGRILGESWAKLR